MYIKYRPAEDEDTQVFTFIPRELNTFDSEAIESVTGLDWSEFEMKLKRGNIKARRAALWVCLRHLHRGLKFGDVSFTQGQVEVEMDKSEIADLIKAIEDHPAEALEGIDKETVLNNMRKQMEEAPDAPGGSGKVPAHSEGESTPSQ